ncbi:MAG TPA: tripartite tricarboxylate transporter substrate-binding protein [Xanthobacteraceae bacterium]|nr:tripartite tricarboxylate transporter substrate-binding protein [Xanthobacteraceae bacterium]
MRRGLPVFALVGAVALLVSATAARAQADYPSRPIRMMIPFPPGGGIDVTGRIAAQALTDVLGQQVVVQNQGGAGGALATDAVVKANPDGYTLLYHSTTGVVHAAVTENLPYDWMRDLAPVAIVTRFAPVMVISLKVPAENLQQFIALMKANPGKYSFASSGTGTAVHLAEELFKQKAGIDMVHVPYHGNIAAMPDLLAGRIAMMIDGVPAQAGNIRKGIVRGLAVTTSTRSPMLPDIPTMKEEGLDYEVPYWTAIYAPIATPKPIIDKLSAAIAKALHEEATVKRLADVGTEAVGSTPAELDALTHQQFALYRGIVQNNKALLSGAQ